MTETRVGLSVLAIGAVAAAAPAGDLCNTIVYCDAFDTYAVGLLVGQDCVSPTDCNPAGCPAGLSWQAFDGSPGGDKAVVVDSPSNSAPHAIEIKGPDDLVKTYRDLGLETGAYQWSADLFIPSEYEGESYFVLLNTYRTPGIKNWSTQVHFDSSSGQVLSDPDDGEQNQVTFVRGAWKRVRVVMDLDDESPDTGQFIYYDDQLIVAKSWVDGVTGGGQSSLEALGLFANGASPVYYDNIQICELSPLGACCFADSKGTCLDGLSRSDCVNSGGVFQGIGTTCGAGACPMLGPNGWEVEAPFTWDDRQGRNDTCDSGATCEDIYEGQDIQFEVTIPYPSNWTFSTAGSLLDTELLIGNTGICSADLVDDGGCAPGPSCSGSQDFEGVQAVFTLGLGEGDVVNVDVEDFAGECGKIRLAVTAPCPDITLPPGDPEDETCPLRENDGCDMDPGQEAFTPIALGQTYVGKSRLSEGGTDRDTDWYQLDLNEDTTVTMRAYGEFGGVGIAGIVQYNQGAEGSGNCDDITGVISPSARFNRCGDYPGEQPVEFTTDLVAGIWWFYVAPEFGGVDFDCDEDPGPDYFISVNLVQNPTVACCLTDDTCEDLTSEQCAAARGGQPFQGVCKEIQCPGCEPADGDVNDDGCVDFDDLLNVLADWNGSGESDSNCDGVVDFTDVLDVLSNWGGCVTCYYCDAEAGALSYRIESENPSDCHRLGGFPAPQSCYPREGVDGDPALPPCEEDGATSANAVHLFSGEKVERVVDLRIAGRGFDFVLARTYRSQSETSTWQGYNWATSYDLRFERQGEQLVLHTGDLRRDEFTVRPDGSYHRAEYLHRVGVTDEPDGEVSMLRGDGSVWTFARLDDPLVPGRVVSMRDRHDNEMTFEYDEQGRLATVRDTLDTPGNQRAITFAYNDDGFLETVTDFTGRQITYAYYDGVEKGGNAGDLKSATGPVVTGTSTENDFPDGKTTVYTYTTGDGDERLNHNLASITDPKGQTYKLITYGTTPGVDFDQVVEQDLGGDLINYTYISQEPVPEDGFATMLTIVNDRVGNVEHRYFDSGHRVVIRREFTGRAPDPRAPTTLSDNLPANPLRPGVDPPFFETRSVWDTNSMRCFGLAPNEDSIVATYDVDNEDPRPRGNLLERTMVRRPDDPIQSPIVESFEYLDSFGAGCCGGGDEFVTRYTDGRGNDTFHEYDEDTGDRIRTIHRLVTQGVCGGGDQAIEESWSYNQFGQTTEYVNPTDRIDVYAYYDSGIMNGYLESEQIDSAGFALTTRYEYDAVGNIVRLIDPRDHDTLVELNALDQIVRQTSREVADGGGVRYERDTYYDANDNVVRTDVQNVDDAGNVPANSHFTAVTEYDILDYPVRRCEESGSYTGKIPGPPELPECDGLPESQFITTEYEYDGNRNRTLLRLGEATEGRQPTNVVETIYDERDLVFQRIRGAGDPDESVSQYDYDANRNPTRQTVGVGAAEPRVHEHEYDSYNRRTRTTDPEENVTLFAYDDNHNQTLSRIDGERIEGESGDNERLSEVIFVYDEMDRRIETRAAFFDANGTPIDDGESVTRTCYDEASYVIQVENDNAHATDVSYDSANRRSAVTDAKGNTTTLAYDANSNVTMITTAERSDVDARVEMFITSSAYDNLDRLSEATQHLTGTDDNVMQYRYDSRNNRTLMVDALGTETRYSYDGINRSVSTTRDLDGDGADGDGLDIVTTETWDDSFRLTAQSDDSGNATRHTYDALDRLIVTQMADGTIHQVGDGVIWPRGGDVDLSGFISGYDVHDNRQKTTDANGSEVECTYDLLNRVIRKDITPGPNVSPDTTQETLKYDGRSRLVYAEDDDAVVIRTHDSLDGVTEELLNGAMTVCVYDGVGNEMSCTYPGGRVIECDYDELERKSVVRDVTGQPVDVARYFYVGPSRVERREYGNGASTTWQYDGIDGVVNPADDFGFRSIVATTHEKDDTTIIDDRRYTWDRMRNKTSRADVRPGSPGFTHEYAYDRIYRLRQTVVTDPDEVVRRDEMYGLDGVGNRTLVQGGNDPGLYFLDPTLPEPADFQMNQYTGTPIDVRTYDRNGNLIGRLDPGDPPPMATITYDYRNRMVGYIDPSAGAMAEYDYDVLNRRITRLANGVTTRYFYNGWQVCEEQSANGNTLATYVYGVYVDEVLAMQRAGSEYFVHSDDLYNVTALTDAADTVIERYEYGDYGLALDPQSLEPTVGSPSAVANPYLFNGRRYDAETGWYYYRTRYLDPQTGRFTTRDTLGIWHDDNNGGNGYAYAANNPFSRLDPSGQEALSPVLACWLGCMVGIDQDDLQFIVKLARTGTLPKLIQKANKLAKHRQWKKTLRVTGKILHEARELLTSKKVIKRLGKETAKRMGRKLLLKTIPAVGTAATVIDACWCAWKCS